MEKSNIERFVEMAISGDVDIHVKKEAGSEDIKISFEGRTCGLIYCLARAQADLAVCLERGEVAPAVNVLDLLREAAGDIIQQEQKDLAEENPEGSPEGPGSDFLQAMARTMGGADHEQLV